MRILVHLAIGFLAVGSQVAIAPLLSVYGCKPNLVLVSLLAITLRWPNPWLFLYGAGTGLALDALSHGSLGVYGISFLVIAIASRMAAALIYENNLLSGALVVGGLSVAEGALSAALFELLDPATPWWRWLLLRVLPTAIYNALFAPLFLLALARLERVLKWTREGWGI
jgi:rod shape-determining protein MreD